MSERSGFLFLASVGGGAVAAWTCQCVRARSEFQHRQYTQKFCVLRARRIMFQAHQAAETCERGPKGPGCSCSKMCARHKPDRCGVCLEPRSAVHMFAGPCCVALSVTCSRKCIDPTRPSVLVKLSCGLCRLVFSCSVQCLKRSVRGHD